MQRRKITPLHGNGVERGVAVSFGRERGGAVSMA
jgi:hypothetical protein